MPAPSATSLIDAVDDQNRPVGLVPRGAVFEQRANFRTVHILVLSRTGELLLQRLSSKRERHPLRWGSSVAGYLYAGETYEAAGARRLQEELGSNSPLTPAGTMTMIDDGVKKFVGVFTAVDDHPSNTEPEHIAEIEFRPITDVERDLRDAPSQFTATLVHVLHFWDDQGRPGWPIGRH